MYGGGLDYDGDFKYVFYRIKVIMIKKDIPDCFLIAIKTEILFLVYNKTI